MGDLEYDMVYLSVERGGNCHEDLEYAHSHDFLLADSHFDESAIGMGD